MEIWAWSSPLGLGAFIVGIGLTLALLCWALSQLAATAPRGNRRR